jgi:hypothetical protein
MFSRLSRAATPFVRKSVVAAAIAVSATTVAVCDIDAKGFDSSLKFASSGNQSTPLSLAGVGMRRKNLYIMEVDV